MHVGGAALDGFLVLTRLSPPGNCFTGPRRRAGRWPAVWRCSPDTHASRRFRAASISPLPVSMGLLTLLVLMQRRTLSVSSAASASPKTCGLARRFAAAAYIVFRSGGVSRAAGGARGRDADVDASLPVRRVSVGTWIAALALGCLARRRRRTCGALVPKGNYVSSRRVRVLRRPAVGTATPTRAGATARGDRCVRMGRSSRRQSSRLAGAALSAMYDTSIVLLLLLALDDLEFPALRRSGRTTFECKAASRCRDALVAITVAVFGGGAYMGGRFVTSERDLGGRHAALA